MLRTALSLSCLTGKPFRIFNIRKGRPKPGLAPQHLSCVLAAKEISSAEVTGDAKGSTELTFTPGTVSPGNYNFEIGTAGATSLVIQTVLPALFLAGGPSTVTVTGGTHVPFSPPFDYLADVFLPTLAKLGLHARISAESYGFYPIGGGKVRVDIRHSSGVEPFVLVEPGKLLGIHGRSGVSRLAISIAERQKKAFVWALEALWEQVPFNIEAVEVQSPGEGTFIHATAKFEHCLAGFSAIGEIGKSAEAVGKEASRALTRHMAAGSAIDPYLADQLPVYLSLCGERSEYTTSKLTSHLSTNLWVIERFLDIKHSVSDDTGKPGKVVIQKQGGFTPHSLVGH
jgi:RNA 3'-terminal phosphate cyclase (ATP)